MNRAPPTTAWFLAVTLMLTGCAAPPRSTERPYSNTEIKQFGLELLNASGMSAEKQRPIRARLTAPHTP